MGEISMKARTTTAILFALVLFGQAARAQDCPPASSPEEARERAGEAFSQGQELFEAGDFSAALERFRCSYGLVPHHNTLYNMGECAAELGDVDAAIRYFQTYVETYPEVEGRAAVEERLRELEEREESRPPPGDEPGPETEPAPETEPPPTGADTRMTLARRLAWVTLGVGAGLAIAGGAVYGAAVSRNNEFQTNNEDYLSDDNLSAEERSELESLRDSGEAMEGAGWALMGIGLASIVTSVVLFFAFDATETASTARSPSLSLGPLVLSEGGGLSVAGSF